jgi:hypothetical protein
MWNCKNCNNWKKRNQKNNSDFAIECISNNLKHYSEINIHTLKKSTGCKYTPTCTIRKQNQSCKPIRKCYVEKD